MVRVSWIRKIPVAVEILPGSGQALINVNLESDSKGASERIVNSDAAHFASFCIDSVKWNVYSSGIRCLLNQGIYAY